MYTKKYQVFVSSTFRDLKEERNALLLRLLLDGFIPAGMELFGAIDEDQFEHIKRIIDLSDYYVVIVGNRYGTVDENGLSYTEKEFLYAKEKGIPVIALLHADPGSLPEKHGENTRLRKKLAAFRKSLGTGRLVAEWADSATLSANALSSLHKEASLFPRVGWVRANEAASVETLTELNGARKTIDELQVKVRTLEAVPQYDDLVGLDEPVVISGVYQHTHDLPKSWVCTTTWRFIAASVLGRVRAAQWDHAVRAPLAKTLLEKASPHAYPGHRDHSDRHIVIAQFSAS